MEVGEEEEEGGGGGGGEDGRAPDEVALDELREHVAEEPQCSARRHRVQHLVLSHELLQRQVGHRAGSVSGRGRETRGMRGTAKDDTFDVDRWMSRRVRSAAMRCGGVVGPQGRSVDRSARRRRLLPGLPLSKCD